MTKKAKPAANAYDDDDFDLIIGELDEQEQALDDAKQAKRDADKKIKARAKELGIPLRALNPALRTRKAFRNLQKIAEGVHEDHVETHLDMVRRMLGDFAGTALGKATLDGIERSVDAKIAAAHEAEQAEGAKVLERAN